MKVTATALLATLGSAAAFSAVAPQAPVTAAPEVAAPTESVAKLEAAFVADDSKNRIQP